MAPPKKRKTGRIVLAGIVLVLGAFVAYGAYARNQPPAGTGDFVAGHGVEYTAADGSYTTQFPKAPVVDTKPVPINGVQLTSNSATVESGAYEMLTISMALPAPIPADRIDQALDDGVNSGVAGANGKLKSKQRLTRGGFPAVDATLEMPDSYGRARAHHGYEHPPVHLGRAREDRCRQAVPRARPVVRPEYRGVVRLVLAFCAVTRHTDG